ncbi:hypothetical protein J6590_054126 [Homalodisca vitripennis]|nr:hypothetical protein J6590_054126 [Homalodisca vitripennis]
MEYARFVSSLLDALTVRQDIIMITTSNIAKQVYYISVRSNTPWTLEFIVIALVLASTQGKMKHCHTTTQHIRGYPGILHARRITDPSVSDLTILQPEHTLVKCGTGPPDFAFPSRSRFLNSAPFVSKRSRFLVRHGTLLRRPHACPYLGPDPPPTRICMIFSPIKINSPNRELKLRRTHFLHIRLKVEIFKCPGPSLGLFRARTEIGSKLEKYNCKSSYHPRHGY